MLRFDSHNISVARRMCPVDGGALLTSYSRVTVVSGNRRVDLALPSALPVSDVVPQVLKFCAPDEAPSDPSEFTLARLGGQSLALSQSLADAGVRDGDVIELRSFSVEGRPAFVEDVRDALEDAVDGAGGVWTTQSTATFSIVTTCAVAGLLLLPLVVETWRRVLNGTVLAASSVQEAASWSLAAVVLVAATWAATRWAAGWAAFVSAGTAAVLAFAAGVQLTNRMSDDTALALTVGVLAASLVAGACRLLTPRAAPLLAATAVLFTAGTVVLAAESLGADTEVVVRVVATVAVLSIGVLPRLSIAAGGLSSADYRVRNAGKMSDSALAARFAESSGLLLGAVIGISVLVGAVAYWLGRGDEPWRGDVWDRVLSLSLVATLLLRSRVFSRTQYMLPLRVAAVLGALATVQQLATERAFLQRWLVAVVALVGAVALGLSILRLSEVTRARIKRVLNVAEFIVVVDLIVVTMGAVALYDLVRN